jgi:tRNA(Ile)-lysidine synthetase-like protein
VRGWRPGDRLAGRRRKIQDVFVDAKVPRSDRDAWPLVVRGDEVVAVPGIVEHPEVDCVRRLDGARDPEAAALPTLEERHLRG